MNEIVWAFLLAGDKFMPEIHLWQPNSLYKSGFTYSACGTFTKNKERKQKLIKTGDSRYIYQNELTCFQHGMVKNAKYASMVYKFLIKKLLVESLRLQIYL